MPRSPSPSPSRADRKRDRDARGTSRERPKHHSRERSRSRSRERDPKRHRVDERPRDHTRGDERSGRHRADERRPADHPRDRDRDAGRRPDRRDEGLADRRERDRADRGGRERPDRPDRGAERDRAGDRDRSERRDRDGERHRSGRDERDDSRRHRSRSHDMHADRADRDRGADRGANGARLPPAPAVKEENGVKEEEAGPSGNGAAAGSNGHAANGAAKVKAEPLSLEELLRKKKQQAEEEAKPRFLSKKEREALALEKLAQQRAGQMEGQRSSMDAMRRERQQQEDMKRREATARDAEKQRWQDERERERELELIRQQYLGAEKEKKKITKASDKYKFNFDWDNKEDTSKDLNPLYNNLHEAALLFGRGMRAGIDRREQKKSGAEYEKAAMAKLRSAAGIEETQDMRQLQKEKEAAADLYDGVDMRNETHWSAKPVDAMTERDWRIFREDFNIAYRGSHSTHPIRNWDEAGLPKELRKAVDKLGYAKPSPIQMAAIPLGIKQLDVIGIAETGSGKTAAFVLPMLMYIMRQPPMTEENEADGPYAVVMAPTRELAQQIEEETIKLAEYTGFRVTSVVGGQSIEEQGSKLRRGVEIVIATPGRLIDCLERHYCVLNQCNYVVLDEADRMIDLGFEPQVNGVLDAMPSSSLKPEDEGAQLDEHRVYRTTYMFSATMPTAVERLARKYLRRPIVVTIGSAGRATDNVSQRVIMLKENEKPHRLETELELVDEKRAIVFVNTKRQCDNVYNKLEELGYRCAVLHGGRTQDQREAGIKGFREDTYNVLIATDVAGRGIDVPDVALVVNYDMPNNIEAYTHRIGRTGRAGKKGQALTFLTSGDTEVYYDLKRVLEECKAPVPPELARHEAAKTKPGGISNKRDAIQYAKK